MSQQPTVWESFEREVEILCPKPTTKRPPMALENRGRSTIAAQPPTVWFERDARGYTDRSDHFLHSNQFLADQLSRTNLYRAYLSPVLVSEADIVHCSSIWFIHPVIMALQAVYPQVQCLSEVHRAPRGEGSTRCDMLIRIGGTDVVVIEYKNRGYLDEDEFFRGVCPNPTARNVESLETFRNEFEGEVAKYREWSKLDKKNHGTALGHNAAIITKQAMAYARKHETRHVALFDWDTLFLWNSAGYTTSDHSWAYGSWITQRDLFRKALLGFILEAKAELDSLGARPVPPPWEPTQEDGIEHVDIGLYGLCIRTFYSLNCRPTAGYDIGALVDSFHPPPNGTISPNLYLLLETSLRLQSKVLVSPLPGAGVAFSLALVFCAPALVGPAVSAAVSFTLALGAALCTTVVVGAAVFVSVFVSGLAPPDSPLLVDAYARHVVALE
ncbi:hypothetical protein GGTG_04657 [Gaeumannomyces tritici R3-111a-1]|uniref:Uncharacterized protein n=1 Tax=Gaeumannomyces tritici (strain R3-111a-1) TaxID=644352 RepID=J3NTQ7_GAET3|nr:hypothetical protein GGTG_04657 [Gaeumannomyces tritici R3-111a-1]EJT79572.1 hypothetical protein GGTG_04657 [Gaeumannomyces tritici R3-111a-1]